jgi:hypothetical protein
MGAWSHTSFGNDAAHDFLYDVESDTGALEAAVRFIEQAAADAYLDAGDACNVLVAGELLAGANGKPPQDFPDLARQLSQNLKPNAALNARAASAIRRILAASELRDLWEDSDSFGDWIADVESLLERLK